MKNIFSIGQSFLIFKRLAMFFLVTGLVIASGYSQRVSADSIQKTMRLSRGSNFGRSVPDHLHGMDQWGTPAIPTANGPTKTRSALKAGAALTLNANSTVVEKDFHTHHLNPLMLMRTYNHYNKKPGLFGNNWSTNFDLSLSFVLPNGTLCSANPGQSSCVSQSTVVNTVYANRADGSSQVYQYNGYTSQYVNPSNDSDDYIIRTSTGWSLQSYSGSIETYNINGFILSTIDPTGIGLTFTYNGSYLQTVTHTSGISASIVWTGNLVTKVTDPGNNVYTYSYTSSNELAQANSPNSHVRTYYYENSNSPDALTRIAIDGTNYSTYTYDSQGRLTGTSLSGGLKSTTFSYAQNTTTITNAENVITTQHFTTVAGQQLLSEVDQSGVSPTSTSTTISYDSNGHPTSSVDARGIITRTTYNQFGLLTDEITGIDSNNPGQQRETQYTWDARNRLVTLTTYGSSTASPIAKLTYSYSPSNGSIGQNRVTSIAVQNLTSNGVANQTQVTNYSYTYYGSGIPHTVTISGPLASYNGYASYTYDSTGNLMSSADAAGNTVTLSGYNGLGLPGSITDANGYSLSLTYDALGNTLSSSRSLDGVNATVNYSYDALNNLIYTGYPDGGSFNANYDINGQLVSIITNLSASSVVGNNQYTTTSRFVVFRDALGKLLSQNLVSSKACHANNGAPSNVTSTNSVRPQIIVPPTCGTVSTTVYSNQETNDALGRTLTLSGNNGQKTTYAYDAVGNVLSTTDAAGNVTSYTYNSHNQIQTKTDPLNKTSSYIYDGAGNVSTYTDVRGNSTNYLYDGFGNKVSTSSPDTGTTTVSYNSAGLPTQVNKADGSSTSFLYDGLNRPTKITNGSIVSTFAYDNCTNGLTHICSVTDSSGSINYTYRKNGQLASQSSSINGTAYTTSFLYDLRDRKTRITYPDGNAVNYSYNTASEITGVTATIGGTTSVVANNMTYAGLWAGPRTSMTLGDGSSIATVYDSDLRVSSITNGGTQALSFSYDTNNNITKISNSVDSNSSQTYSYDVLNRLSSSSSGSGNQAFGLDANTNRTTYSGPSESDNYSTASSSNHLNAISGTKSVTFNYDQYGLGNVTAISGSINNTYTYDSVGRLTGAQTSSGTTSYIYNSLNQRVRKSGPNGSYNYIYDASGTLLGETGNGGTQLSTDYIWLNGSLLGVIRNSTLYFVRNDQVSRPESVTSQSGSVVWKAQNRAFDRNIISNTFGDLNIAFPGHYYDAETGNYYNLHRYYNASLGRYLQADSIGLSGGTNLYAYANGNPVSFIDPNGNELIGAIIGGVAGAIYGGLGAAVQSGSTSEIIAAVVVGGAAGLYVGTLDPTLGVGTLAIIGGVAGGFGDVIGQVGVILAEQKPISDINYLSIVGATIGGALSAAGATYLTIIGRAAGFSEVPLTIGATTVTSPLAVFVQAAGAAAGASGGSGGGGGGEGGGSPGGGGVAGAGSGSGSGAGDSDGNDSSDGDDSGDNNGDGSGSGTGEGSGGSGGGGRPGDGVCVQIGDGPMECFDKPN